MKNEFYDVKTMSFLLISTLKRLYHLNGCQSTINLPSVCQLCFRVPSNVRLQTTTTNTKRDLILKAIKKKKKKTTYSDVISVANTNVVKEGRTVVKSTSPKEILKRLGVHLESNVSTKKKNVIKKRDSRSSALFEASEKVSTSETVPTRETYEETSLRRLEKVNSSVNSSLLGLEEHSELLEGIETDLDVEQVSMDPEYSLPNALVLGHDCDLESNVETMNEEDDDELKQKTNVGKTKKLKVNKSDRDKLFKLEQNLLEQQSREAVLKVTLRAFLDVCISCNMLSRAQTTLFYYLSKAKKLPKAPKVDDIRLFNVLMNAASQQGNLTCVQQVLSRLRAEGIKPNLQTYAACLSCISRLKKLRRDLVQKLLDDIKTDGLNIANLDKECTFVNDQRDFVLKAIHAILPDFEPDIPELDKFYNCNLLSALNEEPNMSRYYDPNGGCTSYEDLVNSSKEQLSRELSGDTLVKTIQRLPPLDDKTKRIKKLSEAYQEVWRNVLVESFESKIKILEEQSHGRNVEMSMMIYPFLIALEPQAYVGIMIEEIRHLAESSENYSLPRPTLHTVIGSKVMTKYLIQRKKEHGIVGKIEQIYEKYLQYYSDPKLTSQYNPRQYYQKLCNEHLDGPAIDVCDVWWPGHILSSVGKFMYDIIIQDVKINVNYLHTSNKARPIPAFYTIYRNSGVKIKEEIKPHPVLVKLFKMNARENLLFSVGELPMVTPPLPWTTVRSGGYILASAKLIRLANAATQQRFLIEKTPNLQLNPIFDTLNQLGECPWIVNKRLLDIIIEMFNNKGNEKLDISPPASECPPLPHITSGLSNMEKAKLYYERNKLKQKKAEMYSLWCDTLYKLSIANHFRDQVFWFPHNLDFRGRVYPCPPHFNHLGNDMSRSILLFAKGEPLGEKGLDWLKIQAINLTGLKKREPVSERLRFANEIIDLILDSADRPLTGKKWWQGSDEPWQTLACCMEIANALRSSDPTKYVCHLPIHQDGSCNGLQHYAALGRDQHGAEHVNLCSIDTPQDVYTGVANLVEQERAADAANGVEIAKVLEGYIKRKIIKQTVMTTVYGVTRYGARLQIIKQLKDLDDFPEDKIFVAATYLAHKTFFSLQQMFTSAKRIQDWFTESARQITQVCGQPVEWVTPLGLPVVQPYHKTKKGTMGINAGDKNTVISCDINQRPNVMKQRNAFPPNFIHSLDSTHMMLTSLFCQRVGITFVSVHDCFWTHPSTVHVMNKICREQFVALHNEPILENLSQFMFEKYSYNNKEFKNDGTVIDTMKKRLNKTLRRVPEKGTFQLENVLSSTYFFS